MAKRMLDDSLLTSPSIAACSPRAQDAFPRFVLLADDFGCFDANPRVLMGRGWALRTDVDDATIAGWLREYEANGMAQLWSEGGRVYCFLTGWFGPKGQRRRDEYHPVTNQKGSRRRTPAPPEDVSKLAESLPAHFPPFPGREVTGKSNFPPLQSHDQSHDHDQSQELPSASLRESAPLPFFDLPRQTTGNPPEKSDTRTPATEQVVKARKRTDANPRHAALVARLCAAYEKQTGRRYGFDGGKHARAITRLIALSADDEFTERVWLVSIRRAPAWPGTCDLASFADRFNDLAAFVKAEQSTPSRNPQPTGVVPNEF